MFHPTWLLNISLLLTCVFVDPAGAHEFEDGCTERTMSIVIRDHTVTMEYAVGCNPKTMRAAIEEWSIGERATAGKAELPGVETTRVFSGSFGDTQTDSAIEARFQAELLTQIAKRMVVRTGTRRLELNPVSVASSPRHHVNALAKLEIELPKLPKGELLSLSIQDNLFPNNGGGVRYSAKSLGKTLMTRSNVAPILIRAQRYELENLTREQRQKRTRIDCQLVFISAGED